MPLKFRSSPALRPWQPSFAARPLSGAAGGEQQAAQKGGRAARRAAAAAEKEVRVTGRVKNLMLTK